MWPFTFEQEIVGQSLELDCFHQASDMFGISRGERRSAIEPHKDHIRSARSVSRIYLFRSRGTVRS